MNSVTAALMFAALMVAGSVSAASEMDHGAHDHQPSSVGHQLMGQPTEPGQGAFAAIAEIVELLNNDPETNWSKVSISALREHLVDMSNLTLNATVVQSSENQAITFEVTGKGRTLRAIQSMVPAHSAELDKSTDWSVSANINEQGAVMRVATHDEAEREKIRALGFFGIMATGGHHQAHHLLMSKGSGHTD